MIAVTTTGPLFEGTLDVKRGMRVGMERATARAADIAREHLRPRSRYSTQKYGHAAESVVTKITAVAGAADQSIGSAYIGKQAGYLARWLEFGTKGHPIPGKRSAKRSQRRIRGTGNFRRIDTQRLLAIPFGGGLAIRAAFRRGGAASVNHPGTRAYRWRSQSQEQINRESPAIFETAMAEALKP